MAAAPQQTQRPRPKRLADDAVIYREYAHQLMVGGERGAYARTARVCTCSDEHVRNVVKRHAKPSRSDANTRELAYEPAPGELEHQQEREALANDALLRQLITPTAEVEITSSPSSEVLPMEPLLPTPEPEVEPIVSAIVANTLPNRERENQETEVQLLAGIAIILTVLVILLSSKSLWLSLVLFPEVMGVWWIVMRMRRALY